MAFTGFEVSDHESVATAVLSAIVQLRVHSEAVVEKVW